MKKCLIYLCMVSFFGMTACEDDFNKDNFKGLDEMTAPQNVLDKDYTLTEADYTIIAGLTVSYFDENGKLDTIDKAVMTAVKTNQYLTSASDPRKVLPAFLVKNWKTASLDATLRLTFNYVPDVPNYLKTIAEASSYELKLDDYKIIWGAENIDYLTPARSPEKYLPKILQTTVSGAVKDDYVVAAYQYSEHDPDGDWTDEDDSIELVNESFANGQGAFTIDNKVLPEALTYVWGHDSHGYMKASAFKSGQGYASESWLVSPVMNMSDILGATLTFEHAINYGSVASYAEHMTLWISVDGEDWQQLTIPNIPKSGSWTFVESGDIDLTAYVGKENVRLAFKYMSTASAAATWEVKNILIKGQLSASSSTEVSTSAVNASASSKITYSLCEYNGAKWVVAENAIVLAPADYEAIGISAGYFTADVPAGNYLSRLLGQKYPYSQELDTMIVVYNYSNATTLKADEYVFANGVWKCTTQPVTAVTEQYALAADGWVYSPDVVVVLKPGRNVGTGYFQALTDWVWENVDQKEGVTEEEKGKGYVTNYGNNDYYYGGSEYQNNFDFRPSAWKAQNADDYGKMSDEELTELMWKRLPEGIEHMLDSMYPDMVQTDEPISYVLKFGIYGIDGSSATKYYSIRCKLVGKGKFSYVENSLKEISSL